MIDDRLNVEQAEYYLDRMFGQREGFVSVAYGHNPRTTKPRFAKGDFRTKYYSWPDERDSLIEEVDNLLNNPLTKSQNIEVFINPALRKTPSREAGTNAPLRWVWCDVDHTPTSDELDRINQLGAMTVLSGSEGHRHVYIPLDKGVSGKIHQALCRALRMALNGDDKIAENDFLRLPGTLNWKTINPRPVWLKSIGRAAHSADRLKDILTSMTNRDWEDFENAVSDHQSENQDVPLHHKAPRLKDIPSEVRKAFQYQPDPGKRNNAIFLLIATAKENGLSREDTHALVRNYPPAMSKWGSPWKISNDVDRIWQKCDGPDESAATTLDESDDGSDQPDLVFHKFSALAARVDAAPAPKFLFEGIIVQGDYGIISAQDKAGKSLIMADAAVSAASGKPWMGKFKTLTPGPVMLCVGEGSERKQIRRLRAIAEHKGLSEDEVNEMPIHILLGVPSIKDEDHLQDLERAMREIKPVLVEIDPFYLAAAGVDFAKLSEVGQALQPVQHMVQRYGAALILSHHWNKTGNGDPHSRTSGVGLTAWGRFLISVELPQSDVNVDHNTGRTNVLQRWHIKGDEVLTESFDIEREVWTDDQFDLSSPMHYTTRLIDDTTARRRAPLKNVTMMARVSELLADNLDGLGVRAINRELCQSMRRRSIASKTLQDVLDQLVLHGYVSTHDSVRKGQTKPYFHIKPFEKPSRPSSKPASAKEVDFSKVKD
jgi:AAA domain